VPDVRVSPESAESSRVVKIWNKTVLKTFKYPIKIYNQDRFKTTKVLFSFSKKISQSLSSLSFWLQCRNMRMIPSDHRSVANTLYMFLRYVPSIKLWQNIAFKIHTYHSFVCNVEMTFAYKKRIPAAGVRGFNKNEA